MTRKSGIFHGGMVIGVGVAVSQVINILSYPILSRLFTPADFGTFSIFFFGMQLLGASLAGRYEQAILMTQNRLRARQTLILAQLVTLISGIVLMVVFGLAHGLLDRITGTDLGFYWMMVPLAGFLVAAQSSFTFMAVRLGAFHRVSLARILKSACAFVIQLLLVYTIWGGVEALIVGETLGVAFSILPVLGICRPATHSRALFSPRRRRHLLVLAALYRDQPLWNLPHVFISQLSRWLISVLIVALYSVVEAGAYFMMFRVVMMPSTLLSNSFSQVYFKAASEEKRETGRFSGALRRTALPLVGAGSVMALVLMLYGQPLFTLILGAEWVSAGQMAEIFAPYVVLQVLLATTAPTYILGKRQKVMFFVASLQAGVFLGGFILGHLLNGDILWSIRLSVWLSILFMGGMFWWYWLIARGLGSENTKEL